MKDARQHIEELHARKAKNDDNSGDLAEALNTVIKNVLTDPTGFIYELLQNADDVKAKDISFTLLENYLIVSHSGDHFTETHVEKICSFAQKRFKDKAEDLKKTGYKGIGFKAIFNICDCVYIVSDSYSFRFDQRVWQKKHKDGDFQYPWQIIPVWTSEEEINKLGIAIDRSRVNFILSIGSKENKQRIIEAFNNVKENPQVILFLRHIDSLTADIEKSHKLEIKLEKESETDKITTIDKIKNSKAQSEWVKATFETPISAELSERLQKLDPSVCPEKLKTATKVEITFAAQLRAGEVVSLAGNGVLFSYLPTREKCGFPFLVNADFLLKADRTQLLENQFWNEFLFSAIAHWQFYWFKSLKSNSVVKFQVIKLIAFPEQVKLKSKSLHAKFQEDFAKGGKVECFPAHINSDRLLSLEECSIDDTGFFGKFPEVQVSGTERLLNRSLSEQKVLVENKCGEILDIKFLLANILEVLKRYYKYGDFYTNLLIFLYEYSRENPSCIETLKKSKFLLDAAEQFSAPAALHIPEAALQKLPDLINLNFTHNKVLGIVKNNLLDENYEWLEQLGGQRTNYGEIVRNIVLKKKLRKGKDQEELKSIIQFIFQAHCAGSLMESDYHKLQFLNLITTSNTIRVAHQCFLADAFKPRQYLESSNLGIFVSIGSSDFNKKDWKVFLLKIGVKDIVKVEISKELYRPVFVARYRKYASGYFEATKGSGSPAKEMNKVDLRKHKLANFVEISLMFLLGDIDKTEKYAPLFFKVLIEKWQKIKNACDDSKYLMTKKASILPFLTYYLKKCAYVSTTKDVQKLSESYPPSFREMIGELLPVADVQVELTKGQIEFCGFKTKISLEDCSRLLDYMQNSKMSLEGRIKKYTKLFQYLLSMDLSNEEAKKINVCGRKLLAADGNLQSIVRLQCYALSESKPPLNSNIYLRELPGLSRQQMIIVSGWFGISIANKDQAKLTTQGQELDEGVKKIIEKQLLFLCLYQAQRTGQLPGEVLKNFYNKLKNIQYFSCKEIYLNSDSCRAYFDERNFQFYFIDRWNHTLTLPAICKELSVYLSIDDLLEFNVILKLKSDEQLEWVRSKKIDFTQLKQLQDQLNGMIDSDKKAQQSATVETADSVSEEVNSQEEDEITGLEERFAKKLDLSDPSDSDVEKEDDEISYKMTTTPPRGKNTAPGNKQKRERQPAGSPGDKKDHPIDGKGAFIPKNKSPTAPTDQKNDVNFDLDVEQLFNDPNFEFKVSKPELAKKGFRKFGTNIPSGAQAKNKSNLSDIDKKRVGRW